MRKGMIPSFSLSLVDESAAVKSHRNSVMTDEYTTHYHRCFKQKTSKFKFNVHFDACYNQVRQMHHQHSANWIIGRSYCQNTFEIIPDTPAQGRRRMKI